MSYLLLFIGSRGITKDCYRYSLLNNRILRRLCELNSGFTKIFIVILRFMRNYRPDWSQVRLGSLLLLIRLLVDTLAELFQVSATCPGITCHVINANFLDNICPPSLFITSSKINFWTNDSSVTPPDVSEPFVCSWKK